MSQILERLSAALAARYRIERELGQGGSLYLALRYQPEPSVKPEVDRVRAELAQLVGEPRP